jgi:alcohol-forming fatty acyl-CoA reductase
MLAEILSNVQVISLSSLILILATIICSSRQIIFNVVASVKFNERLENAVSINLLATKKIINLANRMKNLKSFLHISTLFSNSNRSENEEISERIYDHLLDENQLISISKVCQNIEIESQLLHKIFSTPNDTFPNTYTLTKHFAEKLVNSRAFYLPCGIFRPPIVISSYRENPGFVENLNGIGVVVAWAVKGAIRCIHGDR